MDEKEGIGVRIFLPRNTMLLYTKKDYIEEDVREALHGSKLSVIVEDRFQGKIMDPGFVDHRGLQFIGYEPLYKYLDAIKAGNYDPKIENSIGNAMRNARDFGTPGLWDATGLFGNYFSDKD